MSEKKGIFAKIKSVKNIEIIFALVLGAIALFVFFGNFSLFSTQEKNTSYDFSEYVSSLQNKIEAVISQIDGAGNVDMVITFSGGVEQEYAYTTEKVTENGVVTETNTLTLVSGKPVVIRDKMPQISGVVIVADGAGNMSVRLEIIEAVQALLDVPNGKIEVFKRS